MTRTEHLLTMLAEECAEVAQRASKAVRFGPNEIQPGQGGTNAVCIHLEFADLLAVYEMLHEDAVIFARGFTPDGHMRELMGAKKAKVEKYLAYSAECGTLAAFEKKPAG